MTAEGPAVSVLMCARNAGAYVAESFNSILAQTFKDFELVVVEDASTDQTVRLIEGFADPRIKLLRNAENLGVAASRNIALAQARAPIIVLADADDVSAPDRLERQKDFLDKNPDVGLLGAYADVIDADGALLGAIKTPIEDDGIRREMRTRAALVHGAVAVRKTLLVGGGGYRVKFVAGSDYDMLLRLSEKTRMATLPDNLYRCRLSPSSISIRRRGAQARCIALARRFAEERARGGGDSYEELPASEFVDSSDSPAEGEVLGRYHVFAGKLAGASGRIGLARRHFFRGILGDPLVPQAYALLMVSLAGDSAYRWAQRRFGTTDTARE